MLGLEVFDRGHDFNPRLDPIVRVQARNLRSRMAKYYGGPGKPIPSASNCPRALTSRSFTKWVRWRETARRAAAQLDAGARCSVPADRTRSSQRPAAVAQGFGFGDARAAAAQSGRRQAAVRPRFMVASLILVVILAGITVLWITRTHARRASSRSTDSLAQDLVIRGRYAMDRQTERSLREAIASFEQATARAPRFAEA